MADFFYTDPSIGRVVNNLSRLVNGDPQRDLMELNLRKAKQEMASRGAIADFYSRTADPMAIQNNAGNLFADAFNAGAVQDLTRSNLGLAATLPGASNEFLARLHVANNGSLAQNEAFTVGRQDELDTREQQQDLEKQAAALANAIKVASMGDASAERMNAARIFANPDSIIADAFRGIFNTGQVTPNAQQLLDLAKPPSEATAKGLAITRAGRGTANPYERGIADRETGAAPKAGKPGAAKAPSGLKISEIDNVRTMVVDMLGGDTSAMTGTADIGGVPGLTPDLLNQVAKRTDELMRSGASATDALLQAREETIAAGPEVGGGIFSSGRPSVVAGPGPKPDSDPPAVGPDLNPLPTPKAVQPKLTTTKPAQQTAAGTVLPNKSIIGPGGAEIKNGARVRQGGKWYKNVDGKMVPAP